MKLIEAVSKRTIFLLNSNNYSQYRLCKEGGIPTSSLSHIVNAHKNDIKLKTVFEIADTFGLTLKEFFVYIAAQFIGGLLGALAIFGIIKMAGLPLADTAASNLAINSNAANEFQLTAGNIIGSLLAEVVLTCVFVYVILNVTAENSGAGKKAGLIIGLTLTLVHLVGIGLTGTSVNSARSLATALGNLIYNGNVTAIIQVWMFIIAPLLGGALAALIYALLHKEDQKDEPEEEKAE